MVRIVLHACLLLCWMGIAAAETVVWEHDFATGAAGWNGHNLRELKVTPEGLAFTTPGGDTPLIGPAFDGFPTGDWQRVEIEWRCSAAGGAMLYYTNTTKTQYGGFAPEKTTSFTVRAEPGFQTSVLRPAWPAEKRIIRLRLNPPRAAGTSVLRRIRVIDETPALASAWPVADVALDATGTWRARTDLAAASYRYLILRQTCTAAGGAGSLGFITDAGLVPDAIRYVARADGKAHTCNLALDHLQWKGRIRGVVLKAAGQPGTVRIASLAFAAEPGGAADIEIQALQPDTFRPRAGAPVTLGAQVVNHGGPATVRPQLTLRGARIVTPGPAEVRLETAEPETLQWTIQADQAGTVEATLAFADGTSRTERLAVAPPLVVRAVDYVPKPVPAKTDYQIGAYYYPGWDTAAAWAKLKPFPERRPVLGWYREGEPEVLDWQIKWMVEHGISFILYDWYWNQGGRHLEHGIHQALFNARYQDLIKFALLYANHNGAGSHSAADFEAMARFWIDQYFKRPNYLKVDGKPVVVMFSAHNPIRDMGLDQVRASFERMRQMSRDAGCGGLYLVACSGPDPLELKQLKACGYDAVTCYNWPSLGMSAEEHAQRRAPYAPMAAGYAEAWKQLRAAGEVKLIPPICGGWDDRPWAGAKALVRDQRTPAAFKQHLMDCKRFLDEQEQEPKLRMAFVEAWNELGEGSYIEPHQEYGFDYLEAIRQVFAPASPEPDLTLPEELGRGPFDIPAATYATAWDFAAAISTLGWSGHVTDLRVIDGVLAFTTRGRDPTLTSPPLRFTAAERQVLVIRLQAAKDLQGQVFWTTRASPSPSETRSRTFPIPGGAMQEIRVDLGSHPEWRGRINGLRFDPGSEDGVAIRIASIRLEPR